MTSKNTEKDNLLSQEAEGQDLSRTENTAVNDSAAAVEAPVQPDQNVGEPLEIEAENDSAAAVEAPVLADQNIGEPVESTAVNDSAAAVEAPVLADQNIGEPTELPAAKQPADAGQAETKTNQTKEEENKTEGKETPKTPLSEKDYRKLSAAELVEEFSELMKEPVQYIGRPVRGLREAFDALLHAAKQTEEDGEENVETDPTFIPSKERFAALWEDYRKKREHFAAQMAVEQKANLEERLALIDELKDLIEKEENASISEFHNIQNRWRKCGMVPREQSSAVWQTYQHHVERFFDYLKLNREFRDMEFERNLTEKNKIIARAEELIGEPSIKKAFEELQMLHRLWKEETGPVAADQRDAVWERFSAATRAIHERRHQFLREQKEALKANLDAKLAVCQKIEALGAEGASSHDGWQKKMAEVEELKNEFRSSGMVPDNRNSEVWDRFKEVNRLFNQAKNNYYKEIKHSQLSNLEKKTALVEKAEALKESTDWAATASELKALQTQWKEIGHVPRQKSDALWGRFRAACNFFFERMSEQRKTSDGQWQDNLKAKQEIMAELETFSIAEDPNQSIEALKALTGRWRSLGKVPYSAKGIEDKFNTIVDGYFDQLKISRHDVTKIRFQDKVDQLATEGNKQKFYAEMDFVRRKIDEITREVQQLKNNIEFFSSDSSGNPLVREVTRNIERKSETLEQWKEKLSYMRQIKL